jgi:hypothetical protein
MNMLIEFLKAADSPGALERVLFLYPLIYRPLKANVAKRLGCVAKQRMQELFSETVIIEKFHAMPAGVTAGGEVS